MKKRKLNKTDYLIILTVTLTVAALVLLSFAYLFKPKVKDRIWSTEGVVFSEVYGIPVVEELILEDSDRRPNINREIKWIVVHETDNRSSSATAKNHSNFLLNDHSQVNSWHYTVDESMIVHHLPDHEVGWHAGDKKTEDGGNMNGIGIEMCVNQGSDYQKTLENTVNLIVKLLVEYNLTIDEVKLHQDFSGKTCPHRLITEGKVDRFYKMILDKYNEINEEEKINESK